MHCNAFPKIKTEKSYGVLIVFQFLCEDQFCFEMSLTFSKVFDALKDTYGVKHGQRVENGVDILHNIENADEYKENENKENAKKENDADENVERLSMILPDLNKNNETGDNVLNAVDFQVNRDVAQPPDVPKKKYVRFNDQFEKTKRDLTKHPMLPVCQQRKRGCNKKCLENIPEERRKEIRSLYWHLSYDERNLWIITKMVTLNDPKRPCKVTKEMFIHIPRI